MSSSWLDQSSNANCFKQTYIQGFLDICGNVIIRNTGNLTVGGNANISGSITCGNNIQPYYKYLFQTSDIKQNYNIVQIIPTSDFFTSNNTKTLSNNYGNLSFKNGDYTPSSSSYYNTDNSYNAFNAFNVSVNNYWQSGTNYTNTAYTGNSNTIDTNTIDTYGDWIQINLPLNKLIRLTSFSICCLTPNNAPNEFYLFGSSNPNSTTWSKLYSNSSSSSNPFLSNSLQTYTVNSNIQPHLVFRLVIKSIYNTSSLQSVIINQLNLYGIPYNTGSSESTIYSNNFWFNYGSSTYDLLDSSSVSISMVNTVSGLGNSLYINNFNYLSLPTINLSNANSFSILFWIKINNNQTSTIYEFNSLSNSVKLLYNNTNNANNLNLIINNGSTKTITSFDISNWCHIGIIHFANYVNIYINGIIFQTINNLSFTPDNYVINYIGRSKDSYSLHNSNFYMSDFRTYQFSLNAFQINSIYKVTDILTVNNSLSYHFKDTYFGSNVNIYNDLSLNGNINITSGNILTDITNAGNIFTTNTGIINIGTASTNIFVGASTGKTTISNDVSMNGNVWINRDLSLNGNFNITSGNIFTEASTANIFTTTTNTGIINIGTNTENVFVGASTGKTTIRNDVSMNGNLWINRDLSLNGNFNITSGNIFTGASTANIFTTNAGIINIGTTSTNIFVGGSTGKTTIQNDVSMNGNVSIIGDVSMNNNLYLKGNCNMNTNCNITGNCSIIGKIYTNTINGRLITDTILFNNNINTNGKSIDCSGGNITAFTINAITFNATSDYRIKDDIKQITYNVDKLNPVQYINKESKKEDIGLIAHELQEICPFLVIGEKDGNEYQSVNYIGIIGILIKEIQDLKKRVDIIEKKG